MRKSLTPEKSELEKLREFKTSVESSLAEYHKALASRKHGGIAAWKLSTDVAFLVSQYREATDPLK